MTDSYVQVNIGRKFPNGISMTNWEWLQFQVGVVHALHNSMRTPKPIEDHRGRGLTPDGSAEDSLHFSVVNADVDLFVLRHKLKALAKRFEQDCIALIVGSELIRG